MTKVTSITLSALLVIVWTILAVIGLRKSSDDKDWFDQDGK